MYVVSTSGILMGGYNPWIVSSSHIIYKWSIPTTEKFIQQECASSCSAINCVVVMYISGGEHLFHSMWRKKEKKKKSIMPRLRYAPFFICL